MSLRIDSQQPTPPRQVPAPAKGASLASEPRDVFEKSSVEAAPPTRPSFGAKVLRSPQVAAQFVTRFNRQLGLSSEALAAKNTIQTSSPAKFLRCNPALFYQDLKGPYAGIGQLLDRPAPTITIDGDAHLGNFGTVRDKNGNVMWGLNDYDMAARGSPEADLERLATSIVLFGKDAGLSNDDCTALIGKMVSSYAGEVDKFKKGAGPENSGLKADAATGLVRKFIEKQSTLTQAQMLKKFALAGENGDFTALQRDDKLKDPSTSDRKIVSDFLGDFDKTQGKTPALQRPLQVLDVARRLESGGSTNGLNRFYALLKGTGKDPVIMEIKQELPSAPDTASGDLSRVDMNSIFHSMTLMGGTPNPMESGHNVDGGAYYGREREADKGSIDTANLSKQDWKDLVENAGMALAKAHAHQQGAGPAIAKWIGDDEDKLTANLQKFAVAYSQQTVADTQAYAQALA